MRNIREPVVAGMFYPGEREELERTVTELFSGLSEQEKYNSVISPHAGYIYSGHCAAEAISCLERSKTYIILGPNHNMIGPTFSIMTEGSWLTPLGNCSINSEVAKQLLENELVEEDTLAHSREHSIEVQLPLLQHRFKEWDFVPISIGNSGYSESFLEDCKALGETIAQLKIPVITSSDFSHYVPWEQAKREDREAIERIKNLDIEGFFSTLRRNDASICGFGPISVLMSAMKKQARRAELIAYTSSGEETKDYSSVVAYAAIGFL